MHFIPEALDDYVVKHTENEPELLQKLTRETFQKILQPRCQTTKIPILHETSKQSNKSVILPLVN